MKQLQSAVICCIGLKLYNLSSDLKESDDVSSKYPEIIKRNEQIMLASYPIPEIDRLKIFNNE
jgi:hypothetical protein